MKHYAYRQYDSQILIINCNVRYRLCSQNIGYPTVSNIGYKLLYILSNIYIQN